MASTKTSSGRLVDVMTPDPITLDATTSVADAAKAMEQRNVGDVIAMKDGTMCGVVTDRDIVVRAIAHGLDPNQTALGDICSRQVITVDSNASVNDAVALMREHAIRRIPVTDGGRPVGVVSIGDLAMNRDPGSALADISAAPANT